MRLETTISVDVGPDPARAARDAVDPLRFRLTDDRFDDVRLLVSELVTNSSRHGSLRPDATIVVTADLRGRVLTVDVEDPGLGFELDDVPARSQGSGWGLFFVERLADSWGTSAEGGSTHVWFEVDVGRDRDGEPS